MAPTTEPDSRDADAASDSADDVGGRTTRAHNMIGASITFGLALMIAVVMMIVTGLFLVNAPTSGAFSGSLSTAETIGGAGFVILIVVLLFIPVVGLIGYMFNSGLGSFVRGGLGR